MIDAFPQLLFAANPAKKSRVQKSSNNENSKLFAIITELENSKYKSFQIGQICEKFSIKRRVFYDFVSIILVFGICDKKSTEVYEWRSLNISKDLIDKFRAEIDEESKSKCMETLFDCSSDSSLQNITKKLIQLLIYLGMTVIDLKAAGKLFSQGKVNFKTMLRKLYTICSCFELLGVTVRTKKTGEMKLVRSEWVFNHYNIPTDINALLNTDDMQHVSDTFTYRQASFSLYSHRTEIFFNNSD